MENRLIASWSRRTAEALLSSLSLSVAQVTDTSARIMFIAAETPTEIYFAKCIGPNYIYPDGCADCVLRMSGFGRCFRYFPVQFLLMAGTLLAGTAFKLLAGIRIKAKIRQKPLHQFPCSKSVTSWRGQKSVVSVASCRFPNSITTTCCQQVGNKLAASPSTGKLRGNVCIRAWA